MAIRTLGCLVLAALFSTACDEVSQKKPETGSPTAAPQRVVSTPRTAGANVQSPVETRKQSGPDAAAGERSIRLFGRGVNRQRQTRV